MDTEKISKKERIKNFCKNNAEIIISITGAVVPIVVSIFLEKSYNNKRLEVMANNEFARTKIAGEKAAKELGILDQERVESMTLMAERLNNDCGEGSFTEVVMNYRDESGMLKVKKD